MSFERSDLHLRRLREAMREKGLDAAIISGRQNVQYLSGFTSTFYDDPPLLLLRGEEATLILPESAQGWGKPAFLRDLLFYNNYDPRADFDVLKNLAEALSAFLKDWPSRAIGFGVERPLLSLALSEALSERFPGARIVDLFPVLRQMRRIKTDEEIRAIRRAVEIADIGHAAVRAVTLARSQQGELSELVIFGRARTEMEQAAGERILIKADILSGARTASIGGPPTGRMVRPGDLLLADLIPCVSGYWADTTSTTVLGSPSSELEEMHAIVQEALRIGLGVMRPGVRAQEVDRAMRSFIQGKGYSYPHHSGHGVGLADFEGPLIGAESSNLIEENMVLTLEPGIYDESWGGIRLEDDILVTAGGVEVLSTHSKELR